MLLRLLRTYLRSYKRELTLVVVLQTLQTMATLYLPSWPEISRVIEDCR